MLQDLRLTLRALHRAPGFAVVAVLALGLGVGANTAVFSVVNAVLLTALPYPESDRLVVLVRTRPTGNSRGVSIPKFFAWKEGAADVLASMAVYDGQGPGVSLGDRGDPEQVKAIRVSREFFPLFGVRLMVGRLFTADEDRPGGPRVAVISYGLWQRRFGDDPQVVGRTVSLDGEPHTIIAIAPADFHANPPADIWRPLQADPASTNHAHFLLGGARLKPGVTRSAATARLRVVAEE